MASTTSSKVSGRDRQGRQHVVRVEKAGGQRSLSCDTCGWNKSVQFLPWLKAEEHLTGTHQATVDPSGG